ncbi:aminotransferase class IV [Petrotoga sp. 9PWA.NaAc.5.4]|uniref:aminotransferase class IV n=1 Tax=Petrotoga sp. 9PWA.NaAc.5.4 TaxID=1434328 RepID=UPI000CC89769|nr:aminotransferase class IV [Petrotoga sp. 9PWA.NaAc.5.4]PNR92445.1 aminotransferase IV [Petrotoga sp. 9PWA.NaAc.5.4]
MFFNGKEWVEFPLVSADDEGFVNGYSIYEVIRTYSKIPYSLNKHYERLKKSADFMGLEIPSLEKIKTVLEQANKIHNYEEYRYRIFVTPFTSKYKTFYCFIEELKEDDDLIEEGVIVNISRERKPSSPIIPYYVKTPLNGSVKYIHKKYDYYYDSIVLNEFGYVTECTFSNIFYVSGGVLITPHLSSGILPGITRRNVIELAEELSMEVEEKTNVEVWELLSADEVFLSHTSRGVVPVRRIFPDFTFTVPGVVTEAILENWKDFIAKNID